MKKHRQLIAADKLGSRYTGLPVGYTKCNVRGTWP